MNYQRTIFPKANPVFLLMLFLMLCVGRPAMAQTHATEEEIRDAILGRASKDIHTMDVNRDGKIDVADLIYLLQYIDVPPAPPASLIGEHIGTFFREQGKLLADQSGASGQLPFALTITGEAPLQGHIDNTDSPDNPLGHYSLYFPKERLPVVFTETGENQLSFAVEFIVADSTLAPESELTRSMIFSGEWDESRRILGGSYEETISGFKDNRGYDIPIELTGKFMLVVTTPAEQDEQEGGQQ